MMDPLPSLYVDLTTTLEEKGRHPHGTTRVERSIVAALAEIERPDIGYFIFSRATGRFACVSRQEALALATAPTLGETRRELDGTWQRRPAFWARGLKGAARGMLRFRPRPRPAGGGEEIFAPGSLLLFPSELQRHDFGRLMALKRDKRIKLAFLFYDLLYVLPDSDPRLRDPTASDLPSSDFVVREAALVLPISRFSAGELRKHIARRGVAGPAISPIRLAIGLKGTMLRRRPVPGLDPGRFVLAVGDVLARKNHALLVRVWRRLIDEGLAVPGLVVVGRIDEECYGLVHEVRRDPNLGAAVRFEPNIDDDQLEWLYRNCRFTVFPSFLEGFGLPVAESLGRGKVCLASSATAIPEAAQGAAIELDLADDGAWVATIRALCLDDELLARREAEIAGRFRRLTWDDTVADILAAVDAIR